MNWQTICLFTDMILKPAHFLAFFATIFLSNFIGFSQERFNPSLLSAPSKNGDAVAQKFVTVEVYEYEKPTENAIILKNGFRKHGFVNAKEWLAIKDSVSVSKVQIVFSKYPIRNGEYKEIYSLLFNRIKATIALDPNLNSEEIIWERVWQTHCENNTQVDQLFHGVVIHYKTAKSSPVIKEINEPVVEEIVTKPPTNTSQTNTPSSSVKEERKMSPVLEYMLNHPTTPDALRETASELTVDEAEALILNYYRSEGASLEDGPITDPVVQLNYMYELEVFSRQFPESKDTVVGEVLDRHPEWKSKIVINDWTGSMYGYGSQVILWHLMNLENSGISTITLFNDGDNKPTSRKKIGKTKGIYTENTDNPAKLLELFNEVMSKGGGGDGPENDVEAILAALEDAPDAEVILIADNSACVRDISLAKDINRPVRIILCGYNPEVGINPDYVYLAKITGGGIYTMEDDLEQLNAEIDEEGQLNAFSDGRFKLSSPQCFKDVFYASAGREYSLDNARWNKKDVRILEAGNLGLGEIPKHVYKMENMQSLNLEWNALQEIDKSLLKLEKLSELRLNNNRLSTLPSPLTRLRFLEHLYLSTNNFEELPEDIYQLDFLQELHVAFNDLTFIKPFDSRVLRIVDLQSNKLTAFPSLENQESLEELNLADNQITEAPKTLPKNLTELNLKGNQIERLPDDLSGYQQLKKLNLQGNPITVGERVRIRQALFNVDLTF